MPPFAPGHQLRKIAVLGCKVEPVSAAFSPGTLVCKSLHSHLSDNVHGAPSCAVFARLLSWHITC